MEPPTNVIVLKMSAKKDSIEKTETEIIQERAEVLGRAGEALSRAIQNVEKIGQAIDLILAEGTPDENAWRELNREIKEFNAAREHAKLRYYYLIVTREAMGFRRHASVEEAYRIPPRRKSMSRKEWTGTKGRE